MNIDLSPILYYLLECQIERMDFSYKFGERFYTVKAYQMGKIIRIDIEEKKEKE